MNKFKVGDEVVGLPSATEHYDITKAGWRGRVEEISSDGMLRLNGYSRLNPKHFALAKPAPAPRFLLRYELTTDPIEEFATLAETKKRVKELLSNPDLKHESLRVYEITSVIDVKISSQITFAKRRTASSPKTKAKKSA
jgi:hypothetical protein